jgi:predicted ATPase
MVQDRFFVLTGAFGSGKSALLEHLRLRGIWGIVEPRDQFYSNSEVFRETDSRKKNPGSLSN